MHMDWTGLGFFITAITGLVVGIGTLFLQGLVISRQGTALTNQAVANEKLDVVHNLVNGLSDARNAATAVKEFARGEQSEKDKHP